MIMRLSSAIVLVTFFNYVIGCTSQKTILSSEVSNAGSTGKITGVTLLRSHRTIEFSEPGGIFKLLKKAIAGTTTDDRAVCIDRSSVREIRISKPEVLPKEDLKDQSIAEVILLNNQLMKFNANGGHCNEATRNIEGIDAAGILHRITINQIKEIRSSSPLTIPKDQLLDSMDSRVTEIVSSFNSVFTFDSRGGQLINDHAVIEGISDKGEFISVPVEEVASAQVVQMSGAKTLILIAAVAALVLLINGASTDKDTPPQTSPDEACFFVYSFDGERYVLDADPLGAAICKLFEQSDYSRMDYLKPVGGKYRLRIQNENDQTLYLDQLKLIIADHPVGTKVMYDWSGVPHLIKHTSGPVEAVDERGIDISKLIGHDDLILWQTKLLGGTLYKPADLRHQLTFKFLKPAHTPTAKLLVNSGSDTWGSHMVRELLQLTGNKSQAWFDEVSRGGPKLDEFIRFNEREELYALKIMVKEGNSWVQQGSILGGYEDRVHAIDLRHVEGDTVAIRLNPPMGFWALDYVGMNYDKDEIADMTEIPLVSAEDENGKMIGSKMDDQDEDYWVMPTSHNWFDVSFEAPRLNTGTERSIFLSSTGYYNLHFAKDQADQTDLIQKMLTTPGAVLEYSISEYQKWYQNLFTAKR